MSGDEQDFGKASRRKQRNEKELWKHIHRMLWRMARHMFGVEYHVAQDCTQDFMEDYCKHPRLALWPLSSKTEGWLHIEVLAHLYRYAVKRSRQHKHEALEPELTTETGESPIYDAASYEPGPEDIAALHEFNGKALIQAGRLSNLQRTVLLGIVIDEKSLPEIAADLHRTPKQVSDIQYAAKARLKKLLADIGITTDAVEALRNDLNRLGH